MDNAGGQLWTPVIESCDVIVEVNLRGSTSAEDLNLSLSSAQVGYRGFGTRPEAQHGKPHRKLQSGSCNNDVICAVGNDWRDEISAVAGMSTSSPGGSFFCTGALVNNARQDQTPYFLTANHCGVNNSGSAASLVVYWNYQSSSCGGGSASKAHFSTGATHLVSNSTSDVTLLELNNPVDPAFEVSFAGWDRRAIDASKAIGIHHPSGDVKKIR